MAERFGPLVSSTWLQDNLAEVVIADVRWGIAEGAKREAYRDGHLPGAVFVDLDLDLSDPPGESGRHPLPDPADFAAAMERLAITESSTVVAYDDAGGAMAAARFWFMLDSLGVAAAVLDGGIQGWNGGLEAGEVASSSQSGSFPAQQWPVERFVDVGFVASNLDSLDLLDARSADRYRGVEGGIDVRPGHIPGANSAPWADNLDDEGRFHVAGLEWGKAQTEEPVVYCGSGVSACHTLLALRLAGTSGRLYTGSISEWAIDPSRPVARS
ncbi:MAG: sulfurtransferase [Acidimicrobiales bacterium]